ncbi:FliM/FliN family flagellar motor C-terminal domain-containing protein [Candidatus Thiodiazotropha sp. CDECU1]|uniref:FliM/FliN family flagellar motor C-terminal domain-containing protein n=1 Tax=Candidatus Thiodiazotropha sp. CDECU1 TaxID=3065865 RepID=UPI002930C866|nr:FliM/FliN family flagellar motor C-terminal domain-containing protein [Candidatus Thiodiazotropha sp. CDECU1]
MSKYVSKNSGNSVEQVQLSELSDNQPQGRALFKSNFEIIKDVRVTLEACVGEAELSVSELYDLKANSIVKLERDAQAPIDLVLDGRIVARGQLVVTGDNFGVCITEILNKDEV